MKRISLLLATIVLATMLGCESPKTKPSVAADAETTQDLSAAEAQAIAREAYVYGFPIVMGYKTMYNYAIDRRTTITKAHSTSCPARLACSRRKTRQSSRRMPTRPTACSGWISGPNHWC